MACIKVPSYRALRVVTLVCGLACFNVASADQLDTYGLWGGFVAQVKGYTRSILQHLEHVDVDASRVQTLQNGSSPELPTDNDFSVSYEYEDLLSINLDRYMNQSDAFKLSLDSKGIDLSAPAGYGNIALSYERSMRRYFPETGATSSNGVMLSFSQAW